MRLSDSTIDWINTAAHIAADLEVDGLIFDQDGIHGYNDESAIIVACFQDLGFEFESLGIAGMIEFRRKMKLVADRGDVTVDANFKKGEDGKTVSSLTIKCKKIKYEFRCTEPKRIRDLPKKSLNVKPVFSFAINSEDIKTFKDAATALRNKNVVVKGKDGGIEFTFSDETGDIMTYSLDTKLTSHTEEDAFQMVLAVNKMHKIFKKADAAHDGSVTINILKNNIVHLNINDIDVLIMSEV